jgi:hypothetical protein
LRSCFFSTINSDQVTHYNHFQLCSITPAVHTTDPTGHARAHANSSSQTSFTTRLRRRMQLARIPKSKLRSDREVNPKSKPLTNHYHHTHPWIPPKRSAISDQTSSTESTLTSPFAPPSAVHPCTPTASATPAHVNETGSAAALHQHQISHVQSCVSISSRSSPQSTS